MIFVKNQPSNGINIWKKPKENARKNAFLYLLAFITAPYEKLTINASNANAIDKIIISYILIKIFKHKKNRFNKSGK